MTTTQSNSDVADDSQQDPYVGIDALTASLTDGVLSVTLNRPDSLNSLNKAMLTTIGETMDRAAADPRVRVVKLSGAGRGFCSGAGIGADDHANPGANGTPAEVLDAANYAVRSIVNLPKPVVCVVQGPTAGVGVSLAVACDLVLASDKAYFLLAFTKIGLMPDGGASALIAASIGRARAMKLALLAERLPAREAFDAGLISSVHAPDELDTAVDAVITTLKSGPAVALRKSKQAINAATLTELEDAFARETEGQLTLLAAPDFHEGTVAFQQRRTPTYTDN